MLATMLLALAAQAAEIGSPARPAQESAARAFQDKGPTIKEREQAARTADEMWALALLCEKRKLKADFKRLLARTLELDAQHAGANAHIGNVQHKGRWMTPAERDAAVEAEMAKVSWPTGDEVFRSSVVIIFLIFALAAILAGYDLFWWFVLRSVLRIG